MQVVLRSVGVRALLGWNGMCVTFSVLALGRICQNREIWVLHNTFKVGVVKVGVLFSFSNSSHFL